ncbi:DUF2157 domain-containing protein [uncultured Chitinophaga sp.]|uniref:DUF2157 domain-containing protein n=1 Tax=uncultured Chitinophaga sp. TaxID=339340 RepID=UPI0025E58B1E|nr:DUF2157 domain-containing protein [uncultured Chitinophaga sp.]
MNIKLFEKLHGEGKLSLESLERVKTAESGKLFSLHWELKTLLYLGVLLFSGGLGTLIYKNIDTIGHQAILLVIAAVSGGCYFYCFKHKLSFSRHKVLPPNSFFDYILLLGCLTFVSFITYLQAQYTVFGYNLSAATFIPMLVLFFSAYYFDHIGVLSLAITNLAAWMGVTVTPLNILAANDFGDERLIFTGIILGAILVGAAYLSRMKDFKKHFAFTFSNFGVHIMYIALIAAQIVFDNVIWFLPIAALTVFFIIQARKEHSFYFILISVLYSYFSLSAAIIQLAWHSSFLDEGLLMLVCIYFIGSAIALIVLLMREHKKLKAHDRV